MSECSRNKRGGWISESTSAEISEGGPIMQRPDEADEVMARQSPVETQQTRWRESSTATADEEAAMLLISHNL